MDTAGIQRESVLRCDLWNPASGARSLWAAPSLVASRSTTTAIRSAAALRCLVILTVMLPNPYPSHIHPERFAPTPSIPPSRGRAAQTIANPPPDAKRGSLLAGQDVACCSTGKNGSLRR